jgi:prevent-host-death family protein
MKRMTIREARRSLTHLERILADEGEVSITRRGTEIARLLPLSKSAPIPSHRDLRKKTARMKRNSEKLVRQDRDAR